MPELNKDFEKEMCSALAYVFNGSYFDRVAFAYYAIGRVDSAAKFTYSSSTEEYFLFIQIIREIIQYHAKH